MAYTINLTNNAIFTEIPDGQTDETSKALVLVGKNYSGYGEFIGENFVHLLENSADATFEGTALTGQLWYDTSTNQLNVYAGSLAGWKSLGGTTPTDTVPADDKSEVGDIWFNTTTQQTYIYNSTEYILIGQTAPVDAGNTGPIASTNDGHEIVEYWVNDELVAIMSKDPTFTPSPAITGFATINPGFQLSTTVETGNAVFTGTATNALTLDGSLPGDFISTTGNGAIDGTLALGVDGGLTFGAASEGKLYVSGDFVILSNLTDDGKILFQVDDTGGATAIVLTIDGTTARAKVSAPLTGSDIVNLTYMETAITDATTGAVIKAAYELEANAYTDTKDSKLAGIEAGATADQTDAEIKTAYEANWIFPGGTLSTVDFTYTTMRASVTSNISLTSQNKGVGRKTEMIFICQGGPYTVTLNASWRTFGETSPITLQNNQALVLSLTSMTSLETDVLCAAVVENI